MPGESEHEGEEKGGGDAPPSWSRCVEDSSPTPVIEIQIERSIMISLRKV
jgi:hypothetical protein